jgi:ABC-type polysaccharide/polyol phosphate export permease
MIGGMTVLYSGLFNQDPKAFLPVIASGIIIWGFISGCISEGSSAFINSAATIRQVPAPLTVHVYRLIWNQFIVFLHNCAVLIPALLLVGKPITPTTFLAIPALCLVILNVTWMTLFFSTVSARFRDVPLIVYTVMTAMFMMTPVMWRPDFLPPERQWIAFYNPFTYLLEAIRNPLLGTQPTLMEWVIPMLIGVIGWTITLVVYGRSRTKIAYWI